MVCIMNILNIMDLIVLEKFVNKNFLDILVFIKYY